MIAGHPSILAENILEKDFEHWEEKLTELFSRKVQIKGKSEGNNHMFSLQEGENVINIDAKNLGVLFEVETQGELASLFGFYGSKINAARLIEGLEFLSHLHIGTDFTVCINYPVMEPMLKKSLGG